MEDKSEERSNLSSQPQDTQHVHHVPNSMYENSQGSDASFQINRLLNFNISQHSEVDPDEFRQNKMLNFSVPSSEGDPGMFLPSKKQRPVRDPMSHRIIEKRRRDRMNNCLADLSQLIPSPYLKQGQGRIEKTEIIEMAIKHIRQLQSRLHALGSDAPKTCCTEKFCQGYEECRDNVVRYLMESLGFQPAETQNMYKYLDSQLEKRKAALPAICTCKASESAPTILPSTDVKQTESSPTKIENQLQHQKVFPQTATQLSPYSTIRIPEPQTVQPPQVWEKHTTLERSTSTSEYQSMAAPPQHSPVERRASLPNVTNKTQYDAVPTESKDSVMESPAYSETSVTPIVGDDLYDRQLSTYEENRQKVSEDSGVPSSMSTYTDNSTETSRGKQDADSKNGAYNFKKDIKWRFTADSDKSKDFNRDMSEKDDFKDPLPPHSYSICSADYSSDFSGHNSNGHGSNGSSGQNGDCSSISTGYSSNGNSSSSSTDTSLNNTVPAFALHPMGVYYIPLVLPVSQVMPFMKNHRSMGICHPISIPVSFTGPFHMGIPHVNSGLNTGLGSGYLGDKVHHRHGRHGNAGRRSHAESHNRSSGMRRESKGVQ